MLSLTIMTFLNESADCRAEAGTKGGETVTKKRERKPKLLKKLQKVLDTQISFLYINK